MNKLIIALLCVSTLCAKAQTPQTQLYGKIDIADLELKSCDFEKDANAEVLFDKGRVSLSGQSELAFDRHVRIKIFNDKGKDAASIKLTYYSQDQAEDIISLQAETINL